MKVTLFILLFSILLSSCNKLNIKESLEKAQASLNSGQYEEAENEVSKCMDVAKKKPRIYVLAALAKVGNDKKDEALKLVDKALPLFEEAQDAEAIAHLGLVCLKAEDYAKAMDVLTLSWNINPENVYTATLLINAEFKSLKEPRKYAMRNQHMKLAEKFKSLRNSLEYYNLQAVTTAYTGINRSLIINNFQKAYQIDKKNPTILLNLAVISDAVFNQKGRAMTYYNQYLEAVKLLPKEKTQSEKVRRRLTELQNL
jgi:tetratricopeptide (TPR) repeat protein